MHADSILSCPFNQVGANMHDYKSTLCHAVHCLASTVLYRCVYIPPPQPPEISFSTMESTREISQSDEYSWDEWNLMSINETDLACRLARPGWSKYVGWSQKRSFSAEVSQRPHETNLSCPSTKASHECPRLFRGDVDCGCGFVDRAS